jgi:hypothetical protein
MISYNNKGSNMVAPVPDIEWTDDELRAAAAWLHQRMNEGAAGDQFARCEAKHAGIAFVELRQAMQDKPRPRKAQWYYLGMMVVFLLLAELHAGPPAENGWSTYGPLSKLLIFLAALNLASAWSALREYMRWADRQYNLKRRIEIEAKT